MRHDAGVLSACQCGLIPTGQSAYGHRLIVRDSRIIADTRNTTAGMRLTRIMKA